MEEIEQARDHLVTDGKETNLEYKVGSIQLLGFNSFASVICIAEVEGQLLVCLPNSVWNRRSKDRLLPQNSFKKSISVEVAAVPDAEREAVIEDVFLKVWIGLFAKESEKHINYSEDVFVEKGFEVGGVESVVPLAGSLVAIAAEHFVFMSAEEGLMANGEDGISLEQRVHAMEGTLSSIQLALDSLVAQKVATEDKPSRPSALKKSARAPGVVEASSKFGASPKRSSRPGGGYEGLDRTVVEAAL